MSASVLDYSDKKHLYRIQLFRGVSCEVVIRSNYTDVSRMDIRTHGHTDNLTDGEWTVESGRPGLYGVSKT